MSRWGKVSLLVSALSMAVMLAARMILGGWVDLLYVPLGLFLGGLILAIVFDLRTILEFLTMRTTKHGMNMGALILLMLVLMVSINFLGKRFNKTFDFTEEKLNSLADQSASVLKGLKDDLSVIVFYKGEESNQKRAAIKQNLTLFSEASSKVKTRFVNTYIDNVLAQQYLGDLVDKSRGDLFVFVDYRGKKVRVELDPASGNLAEEAFTSAVIRATREGEKKIYFLSGHGERDFSSSDADGISELKEALEGASFKTENLNLAEQPQIPADAKVLALIGSTSALLEPELEMIRGYLRQGGRLFMAADPGQNHNLALLSKPLGAEFKNNYILNPISQIVGRGLATGIGLVYDTTSDITKKFRSGEMTVFDLAGEVVVVPETAGVTGKTLVKTHESSFAVLELTKNVRPTKDMQREISLGVLVEGTLPGATPAPEGQSPQDDKSKKTQFAAVIFGDSDFVSNKSIAQGLNRDLALNSFSFLAQEDDLISIRPKQPKGTQLMMTKYTQLGLVGAGVGLPLILLILGGVVWFRRRGA